MWQVIASHHEIAGTDMSDRHRHRRKHRKTPTPNWGAGVVVEPTNIERKIRRERVVLCLVGALAAIALTFYLISLNDEIKLDRARPLPAGTVRQESPIDLRA